MVAGREDRCGPEPLVGQVKDRVDVIAGGQSPEAVDRGCPEFGGCTLGPVRHLLADPADLEPVGQCANGGKVSRLPLVAQADDADAEFHEIVSAVVASAASISRSRSIPLSAMSLRHQAPAQRISFTAV